MPDTHFEAQSELPKIPAESRPPLTADRAIELVHSWSDLTATRRRDLASALSKVCTLVGLPAGAVLLTPIALRQNILCRSPVALGLNKARKSNLLSLLRAVLQRHGTIDKTQKVISHAWNALTRPLDRRRRLPLINLARYCWQRGIEPIAVTDQTIIEFEAYLTTRTLTPEPKRMGTAVRRVWNHSAGANLNWPTQRLARHDGHDYILPLSAFPDSFQQDMAAFGRRMTASVLDDPFGPDEETDDQSPLPNLKPLRPTTVALRQSHVRWAASALVAAGVPIAEIVDLHCLVTPVARVRSAFRFLLERSDRKASANGMHVAEILRIIGRYHARSSDQDLAKIKAWSKPLKLKYEGMTEKNNKVLKGLMTPEREAKFLALSGVLMAMAMKMRLKSPDKSMKAASRLALRAVAIGILTTAPMRLANLRGLRMDRHLTRPDPSRGRITHIEIPLVQTKNDNALVFPVSPNTAALMDDWIKYFHPALASSDCVYLFPGQGIGNRPMSPQGLRDAIKNTVDDFVGVRLTPHQFRHAIAFLYLVAHPGCYEDVRRILGHKTLETTLRFYVGSETTTSLLRLDEVLFNKRCMVKPKKPGGR